MQQVDAVSLEHTANKAVRPLERYRDQAGGGLMVVLGVAAAVHGHTYSFGRLQRIGPGFFPVALGVLLGLIGLAIVATARPVMSPSGEGRYSPQWRGWGCITLSLVLFVVLGKYGGLVPATFAIVFVSALGDRRNTVKDALTLALAMATICVLIFWWALKLQFPLFTWG